MMLYWLDAAAVHLDACMRFTQVLFKDVSLSFSSVWQQSYMYTDQHPTVHFMLKIIIK